MAKQAPITGDGTVVVIPRSILEHYGWDSSSPSFAVLDEGEILGHSFHFDFRNEEEE